MEARGVDMGDDVSRDVDFVRVLEADFPEVKFVWTAPRFSFRMKNGVPTVFLGQPCPNFALLALHELGHALCKHKDYIVDVQRLKIESEAWERAKTVYFEYARRAGKVAQDEVGGRKLVKDEKLVKNRKLAETGESVRDEKLLQILPEWDEDFVQDKLDSYRDWLHAKSKCKQCGLTCYQTEDGKYHCPRCEAFMLNV